MEFYRKTFPSATVTPKLHMLEKHVVPWLQQWEVGSGLMGEQGAESIHHWFNSQKATFHAMYDDVDRIKATMKEHFVHIAPTNVALQPPVAKRRKNEQ